MALTKTEKLSHVGILLVGISALIVSVWQVQLSRQHNKLSVRPYLRFNTFTQLASENGRFKHEVKLSNSGQGPAIVKSFTFLVDDRVYGSLNEAMVAAGITGNIGTHAISTFDPGDVIEEKTTARLLGLNTLGEKDKPITITVVYESLYEEEFTVTLNY